MADAYSFGQIVPAELVTGINEDITALIKRDYDVSVGAGLLDQWTTVEKNAFTVFPAILDDDPHDPLDIPNAPVITYQAFDGGTAYHTHQTYTTFVPTLDEEKADGTTEAASKSLLYLDGGFFHDDGAGSVLYDSEEVDRFNYTVIGVQSNIVGAAFTVLLRDSALAQHNWNSAQWEDFYNSFYNHVIFTRDNLEAAVIAIDAAADSAAIQTALDTIPPPNNTL